MNIPKIIAEPLRRDAFADFGQVLEGPSEPGRDFFNDFLENTRANARVDLSIATIEPAQRLPLRATVMERHPYSSQTFLPLKVARYLVVVAPDDRDGEPDLTKVRAFLADGSLGVTYRSNIWHHGMTVLDETASMAVLMWCDGSSGDEEFLDIKTPFDVVLASAAA